MRNCVEKTKVSKSNEELSRELEDLRQEFSNYKLTQEQKESKKLRTALIFVGSFTIAVLGFVWTELILPILRGER